MPHPRQPCATRSSAGSTFAASPVLTHDPEWTDAGVVALDCQLAEATTLCREHLQASGRLPFFNLRRTPSARGRRRRDIAMCRIADGHALLVDVDGEAVACGVLAPSYARLPTELAHRAAAAVRLGAVDAPDLPGRLASCRERLSTLGLFDGKERKRSPYGTCGTCRYLHECQVCPLSIANQAGNDDPDAVPPLPCAFNLLAAKYRRRLARRLSKRCTRARARVGAVQGWGGAFAEAKASWRCQG